MYCWVSDSVTNWLTDWMSGGVVELLSEKGIRDGKKNRYTCTKKGKKREKKMFDWKWRIC